jgi:hypothetical protein
MYSFNADDGSDGLNPSFALCFQLWFLNNRGPDRNGP